MIKTLVILVILAWLVTFGLVLALISTLDDLCEYEKKIKKIKGYIIANKDTEFELDSIEGNVACFKNKPIKSEKNTILEDIESILGDKE